MTSPLVTLNCIPCGSSATVASLEHGAEITKRLLELGITRGTDITVLGNAPLGDPMIVRVRGCQFAIRKNEAKNILMEIA
ncbi:FeoA family protein [Methanorbis furvi]|uniref:Ferrous iron transporter FeoA-like domain-containing protein n=1 Tax=Methanorbis furvi TaxID=3028299 RepID=A0AAE4MAE9_9EURY|nr:hypothetical protein [Methanocorpusculaceae archaeon Ag1]